MECIPKLASPPGKTPCPLAGSYAGRQAWAYSAGFEWSPTLVRAFVGAAGKTFASNETFYRIAFDSRTRNPVLNQIGLSGRRRAFAGYREALLPFLDGVPNSTAELVVRISFHLLAAAIAGKARVDDRPLTDLLWNVLGSEIGTAATAYLETSISAEAKPIKPTKIRRSRTATWQAFHNWVLQSRWSCLGHQPGRIACFAVDTETEQRRRIAAHDTRTWFNRLRPVVEVREIRRYHSGFRRKYWLTITDQLCHRNLSIQGWVRSFILNGGISARHSEQNYELIHNWDYYIIFMIDFVGRPAGPNYHWPLP
jgi:hypothetical protein